MSTRPILGLDPGLRALGVAILDPRGRLRHASVLAAPRAGTPSVRLRTLRRDLVEVLATYRPRLVVLEAAWPSKNPSLALLHRVTQMCRRSARARRIPVVEVPSGTIRRTLLGDGRAGKAEMARFVATRYPQLRVYLGQREAWKENHFQNLFDAVALGLYALKAHRPFRTPRHRSR